VYVKVWAIKHFERVKDFTTELSVLDGLWEIKALAGFVNAHRGIAYWGLHRRDEARVALTSAISEMDGLPRLEVSSWFCYRELADDCGAVRTPACSAFLSSSDLLDGPLPGSGPLLTYLRARECQSDTPDYGEIGSRAPDERGEVFVRAAEKLKENKIEAALQVLRPILYDENWDHIYKDDALRRIVGVASSEGDLAEVTKLWRSGDPTSWEWRAQGVSLVREFMKRRRIEDAVSVGRRLARAQGLPEKDRQALVVFAYKNGQRKFAFSLIQPGSRAPASLGENSEEEYRRITARLAAEFLK
jgi:hypothetical protein